MPQKLSILFTIIICWTFSTTTIFADRLLMPNVTQISIDEANNIARPTRTMSMEEVLKNFGEPQQKSGPIGNPPITRWSYQKYIVVFESKYVIHSVLKSKLPNNIR